MPRRGILRKHADSKFLSTSRSGEGLRTLKKFAAESLISMRLENDQIRHQPVGSGRVVKVRKGFSREDSDKTNDSAASQSHKHLTISFATTAADLTKVLVGHRFTRSKPRLQGSLKLLERHDTAANTDLVSGTTLADEAVHAHCGLTMSRSQMKLYNAAELRHMDIDEPATS